MNKQSFSMNKQSFSANKDGQKVWGGVLSTLKLTVTASSFKTWFSGSYVMDCQTRGDKKIIVVGVGNGFLKEQIEKRYMDTISKTLRSKYEDFDVLFVVSGKETQKNDGVIAPLLSGLAPLHFNAAKPTNRINPSHLFSNFVVGPSNNIAHLAAAQVADNLGKSYNPLVFWGPTGVGKTHLLHAIGNEVLGKYDNVKVLYVTSEKFTNDYLESLNTRTQANFRNKYRSVHLLLFDDLQFLAGKESTQDEFFHTFNELILSGGQVVAVSDRHPRELGKLKDRLVSRFLGGMCVDIGLPDVETKSAIVISKCRERGVALPGDIVETIAQKCQGGARELEGILTNVLAQMKFGGSFSADSINGFVAGKGNGRVVRVGDIIDAVIGHFKVKYIDLKGPSRKTTLVHPRQVAMLIMRDLLNLPYEAIGALFGGRDHSTIMHSIDKLRLDCEKNSTLRDEVLRIKELLGV